MRVIREFDRALLDRFISELIRRIDAFLVERDLLLG